MIDYILITVLVIIIAAAAFYVYKAKKNGKSVSAVRMAVRAVLRREIHIATVVNILRNLETMIAAFRI